MVVRQTKFSPQRTLPLHPTVVRALVRYQEARHRVIPIGEHFFVGRRGSPFTPQKIGQHFRCVVRGIEPNGARPAVRFGDLRHTFASRLISAWSRRAKPVPHYLALLSRYMGHKNFNATWWYVSPDCFSLHARLNFFNDSSMSKLPTTPGSNSSGSWMNLIESAGKTISPAWPWPRSRNPNASAGGVRPDEPPLRGYLRSRFPCVPDVGDVIQDAYIRILRGEAVPTQ